MHGLRMNLFAPEVHNSFAKNLSQLYDWAVTRKFGLGTTLPGDDEWLIESLSDSTIYMAYYAIAHLLQGPCNLDGQQEKPPVDIAEVTDAVFEYIYRRGPLPELKEGGTLTENLLKKMRNEFSFWYPLDIRTSGKDLLQNHLTFFVYNHCAVFDERYWPRAIRINGHVLVDNEKMAKSTGNFFTLQEATTVFGADVTRFVLADAGDAVEDANFSSSSVNNAILKLTRLLAWSQSEEVQPKNCRDGEYNLLDKIFDARLDMLAKNADTSYDKYLFRDALKWSFFEMSNARADYCKWCGSDKLHKDLVTKFLKFQCLMLQPICPHVSQYLWWSVVEDKEAVLACETFPCGDVTADQSVMLAVGELVETVDYAARSAISRALDPNAGKKKKKKKGQQADAEAAPVKRVVTQVNVHVPKVAAWQDPLVAAIRECAADCETSPVDTKVVLGALKNVSALAPLMKRLAPVVVELLKRV